MKDAVQFLSRAGLRATRPRRALANILFADGADRHFTAEWISARLAERGERMAIGTIYNSLRRFVDAGLLREIAPIAQGAAVFDTNTRPHHHFFNESTGELTDIPADALTLSGMPAPPDGRDVTGCDIIIRIR